MKYKLKPCPSCGKFNIRIGRPYDFFLICCTNCGFSVDSLFHMIAVWKWNHNWFRNFEWDDGGESDGT